MDIQTSTTMVAVEQQAKLGVSAEESKEKRLKRQQARFRDRGGVFVPSTSNPLVNILLARTVSGESPSRPHAKNVAKHPSSSKPRRSSLARKANLPTSTEDAQAIAVSRKGKTKAAQPEVNPDPKPTPKRRGRPAQSQKKASDSDSDAEQRPPANTKSKCTPKGNGKQRAALSTSHDHSKAKPKPKAKTKTKPAKAIVEVLDSDHDLAVNIIHKPKSKPNKIILLEDDDAPIVKKRAIPRADDLKASGTKSTHDKTNGAAGTGKSGKKVKIKEEECPKMHAKKRLVSPDDDDDLQLLAPPSKTWKAPASTKPNSDIELEPPPCPARDLRSEEMLKATDKKKEEGRAELVQAAVEFVEDDQRPPEHVSKLKKRKKEENNYDDRPRKVVKFSEPDPPHLSSHKLKENKPDKKRGRTPKSKIQDELDASQPELADKPPVRAKTPKGPPRAVLARMKASAARHLRCNASEPDELDCLS